MPGFIPGTFSLKLRENELDHDSNRVALSRLKDPKYLEQAQLSQQVMSKLRKLANESEDVEDDKNEKGEIKCVEGSVQKLGTTQSGPHHKKKPSSKRYGVPQFPPERYKLFY